MPPIDQHTVDGYDMQFGTNVTGGYAFPNFPCGLLTIGLRAILFHQTPDSCPFVDSQFQWQKSCNQHDKCHASTERGGFLYCAG